MHIHLKRHWRWLGPLALIQALGGCQYASFYNKITDAHWNNADTSPESMCESIGGMRGDFSLDRCVQRVEADYNGEPMTDYQQDFTQNVFPQPVFHYFLDETRYRRDSY